MRDPIPLPKATTAVESPGSAWRKDTLAGLVNAVVSVPDGLACAALAGVNPVYGLYTSIAAPLGGSFLMSAQLMQIATTSASALVAAQAIASYPAERRDGALFLLVVLVGVLLAVFGLLKFGRLARFVSHAVMTGFLIGVAVVLILDQLAPFVGVHPRGANEVVQFVDLLARVSQFSLLTIITGLFALGILFGLARTRFAALSSLVALVVPSLIEVGGRLYLSGVDKEVSKQLRRAGKLDLDRVVHLVPAADIFGASTEQAVAHASAWLGSTRDVPP